MKLSSLTQVAKALQDAEVPFILVGGLAVVAHGYGRSTQDVDIVIRLDGPTIRAAFSALGRLGYAPRVPVTADTLADDGARERLRQERGMVVLAFHSESHAETPVDLFTSEPFPFAEEYASALVVEAAPGVPVHILRLGALLDMKRRSGRPQDMADVAELTSIHGGTHA